MNSVDSPALSSSESSNKQEEVFIVGTLRHRDKGIIYQFAIDSTGVLRRFDKYDDLKNHL